MIDSHVHLRDWRQSNKETIEHGLEVAERVGLDAVFDMPNTSPVIDSYDLVKDRLEGAEFLKSKVFYGLYVGLTSNPEQVKEAVKAWEEFFPEPGASVGVVGLKMFAGSSTGDLLVGKEEEQKKVYETLAKEGYEGVLAVHCEKESFLVPTMWDSSKPVTHSQSRPKEAETASIGDQIKYAEEVGFLGNLHICHVSVPGSVYLVGEARQRGKIKITCGVTPHHCLFGIHNILGATTDEGLLYKVNPPIRLRSDAEKMLTLLQEGKIDWIETDHAPHTLAEKTGKALDAKGNPQYMSGFPGLPFLPHFLNFLRRRKMSEGQIYRLTHGNIIEIFGLEHLELPVRDVSPDLNLHTKYGVDVYKGLRGRLAEK